MKMQWSDPGMYMLGQVQNPYSDIEYDEVLFAQAEDIHTIRIQVVINEELDFLDKVKRRGTAVFSIREPPGGTIAERVVTVISMHS